MRGSVVGVGCRAVLRSLLVALAATLSPVAGAGAEPPPAWAYPWDPAYKPHPADATPRRLAGSTAEFSLAQARDLFFAPDWHPGDHPPMPEVVARGRKPELRACGSCHRAEGTGGPENVSLAGQPAAYLVQQMADFRSGARSTAVPERPAHGMMVAVARATSEADDRAAAEYFAALTRLPVIRVVETDVAPRVFIAGHLFVRAPEGGTEPLGRRILEVPDDLQRFELRDSRAEFVVYVPPGSIARGERLASTGGDGRTVPCAGCHGPDLRGAGNVPGIAGRSPTYLVRQLYDFQQGARAGAGSVQMRPTVEHLQLDDMIALAAHLASRQDHASH